MQPDSNYVDIYSHTGKFDTVNAEKNIRTKKSRRILKSILCFLVIFILCATTVSAYIAGVLIGKKSKIDLTPAAINTVSQSISSAESSVYKEITDAMDSVLGICVYNGKEGSFASGVVISTDGYIITNDHVFSNIPSPDIKVYDKDGNFYNAAFIGADSKYDIAVIKIEKLNLKPAKLSYDVAVGEKAYCIGCPLDSTLSMTVTEGIVSGVNRRIGSLINEYSPRLIQTDAAINPGCSGGAIINSSGRVIGISCSKVSDYSYEGIGFAIPINDAMRIANILIENGSVTGRAKLGITYNCISYGQALVSGTDCGIVIKSIDILSDLYGKGFGSGDVITSINGQKITCEDNFLSVIEACAPNDKVTLTITTQSGLSRETDIILTEEKPTFSYEG